MKAAFTSPLGVFEVEAPEVKDVFRQLATVQEVFGSEHQCGVCQSADIRLQYREVDDFKFYELLCMSPGCRARFAFGQAKKGGALFPKRKDEDGGWLPHGGWSKYVAPGAQAEAPEPRRPEPTGKPAEKATGSDLQSLERYGKLAKAWGVEKAPVRFPDLVQMCRDYFAAMTAPSSEGAQEFDKLYRRYMYEHPQDSLDPANIKAFMSEVWEANLILKKAEVPY